MCSTRLNYKNVLYISDMAKLWLASCMQLFLNFSVDHVKNTLFNKVFVMQIFQLVCVYFFKCIPKMKTEFLPHPQFFNDTQGLRLFRTYITTGRSRGLPLSPPLVCKLICITACIFMFRACPQLSSFVTAYMMPLIYQLLTPFFSVNLMYLNHWLQSVTKNSFSGLIF